MGRGVSPMVTATLGAGGSTHRRALSAASPPVSPAAPALVAVLSSAEAVRTLTDAGVPVAAQLGRAVSIIRGDSDVVERLSRIPEVLSVRLPQMLRLQLDVPGQGYGAVKIQQTEGLSGAGTLFGIIDSGIDYTHLDLRHADGTTRIKALWDQLDTSYADSGGTIGSPPPMNQDGSPGRGTVYTEEQINTALDGSGIVNSVDLVGHGTLVASIAAGNGQATGGGEPSGVYLGVAPQADIIAVRAGGVDRSDTNINGDVIGGLQWIDGMATALGEPVVVNMSFGGQVGAHDGTTPEEIAIDSFAQRSGRAVSVSAGNDGTQAIHASGSTRNTATLDVFYSGQSPRIVVDCWIPGSDIVDLGFTDPDGAGVLDANVAEGLCAVTRGSVNKVSTCLGAPSALNGDREVIFLVEPLTNSTPISSGDWKFYLRDEGGVQDGTFDCWEASLEPFTSNVDRRVTIGQPGTARGAITAGAWSGRSSWPSLQGETVKEGLTIGALAAFSSVGPTRDGRLKPELTAPGEWVLGAWSIADGSGSGIAAVPPDPTRVASDGVHVAARGTSFSAPQVAGAIDLLFELDPSLTAADLRSLLTQSASADEFTGDVPNDDWGFGKLDVQQAIAVLPTALATSPTVEPTSTPTATSIPATASPTTTATHTLIPSPTASLPRSSGGGGSGCAVRGSGGRGGGPLALLAALAAVGISFRRRRQTQS